MAQNMNPHGTSLFEQMYAAQQQQRQQDTPLSNPFLTSAQSNSNFGTTVAPTSSSAFYPPQPHAFLSPPLAPYYAPPPPAAPYTPPPPDSDYFKGFHDGITRPSGPVLGSALSWIAPAVVNLGFFLLPIWYVRHRYMRTMSQAAAGQRNKSGDVMGNLMEMFNPIKSKSFRMEVKGTRFTDVIGIPEAKEDLKQYVDFLKDPAKFTRLGARLPKGCLLTGKPGTGKTLLARAVAGEASTPFFSCSGADFIEILGGSGPKRVRELFAEARKAAPCVVFIDEIDAIGSRNQDGRSMGGSGEENRTINQLLAELDGLGSKEAVVVIAATNYLTAIDKALLREGRFDRKINIPLPDFQARCELFEFYLNRVVTGDPNCKPKVQVYKTHKKADGSGDARDDDSGPKNPTSLVTEELKAEVKVVPGVQNKDYAVALAERTPGVSPAQVATIVNEAALNAAMTEKTVVPLEMLHNSIDDVLIGKKHRQRMSGHSLRRTALHEVGHCIMAWMDPLQKDVIKLSIIPRGRAGGYTQQIQDEAMEPVTEAVLFSQLCVLMGGRVAELLFEKDISIGAMDDLQRATRLAMKKLLTYGMSKTVGQLAFKPNEKNDGRAWMTWSEDLHVKIEAEAKELINKAYMHTVKLLSLNKDRHHTLTQLLLQKKELSKSEIEQVLGPRPATPMLTAETT